MKLWKRRATPPTPRVSPERAAAISARVESEKAAARVNRDTPKVREVARAMRSHREENGFGSLLAETLRDVR